MLRLLVILIAVVCVGVVIGAGLFGVPRLSAIEAAIIGKMAIALLLFVNL